MLFLFIILIILVLIAWEDFKHKAVYWLYFPLLLTFSLIYKLLNEQFLTEDWLKSLLFIVTQLSIVYLFFAIKLKKIKYHFFDQMLGLGDVLYFIAIIPLFNFPQYILFHVGGLVFAFLGHIILLKIKKMNNESIPLLGWLGIFYSFALISNILLH